MRNSDLAPLYRSAIGFDRLFNLLESGLVRTKVMAVILLITSN